MYQNNIYCNDIYCAAIANLIYERNLIVDFLNVYIAFRFNLTISLDNCIAKHLFSKLTLIENRQGLINWFNFINDYVKKKLYVILKNNSHSIMFWILLHDVNPEKF